jgi:hypothetical protein
VKVTVGCCAPAASFSVMESSQSRGDATAPQEMDTKSAVDGTRREKKAPS